MTEHDDNHWVGTWTTAPTALEGVSLAGQTVRMISRISVGGAQLRVRISNAYGTDDLILGAARVALHGDGAETRPDSSHPLTFSGSPTVKVPAGALVVTDPVDLEVEPLTELAVSLYLPDDVPEAFGVTGHDPAIQTNYISTPGDFTAEAELPVAEEVDAFIFVTGVEVVAPREVGGIVALGDSITEGNLSTSGANRRWPDRLAQRLVERGDGRSFGVSNQGLGGSRLLHDGHGDSGLRRFDRDVLAQPGVTDVIVALCINDIRNSWMGGSEKEDVSAEELIRGLDQLVRRAKAGGLRVFGATILPFENETFKGGFYTPEGDEKRHAVNAWIRDGGAYDGVIDFEAALRDPDHPASMRSGLDSGDHLHPSDAGYDEMGDSIDLGLFDRD